MALRAGDLGMFSAESIFGDRVIKVRDLPFNLGVALGAISTLEFWTEGRLMIILMAAQTSF